MGTFDRLQNKQCYNEVNVVEAFVVSLILLLNFMLVPTLNSQTILWRWQVVENPLLSFTFFTFVWYTLGSGHFQRRVQGGRKLPGVWKLQQLGSQSIKSIGHPTPGYEDLINNLSKKRRGAKTVKQFFTGY